MKLRHVRLCWCVDGSPEYSWRGFQSQLFKAVSNYFQELCSWSDPKNLKVSPKHFGHTEAASHFIFLSLTIQLKFLLFFSPLQRSIKKSISAFHKNLIKLGNKQKYLKAKFQISKLIEEHFHCFLVELKDGGNNDDDEDGDVINDDDGGKIDCSLIYDLSRDSIS